MFLHDLKQEGIPDLDILDSSSLNKRHVYRQRVKQDLRKRFRTEYLGHLRQSSKFDKNQKPLQIGDIVLVSSVNTKRIEGPLAKVMELYPSKDGSIRLVKVKMKSGEFLRPVPRPSRKGLGRDSILMTRENIRPYVPEELRFEVFRSLHNLSHPGIRATKRLIQDRFIWPSMLKDIAKWTRCCIPCQRCKVQRHTVSPMQPFAPTVERFQHVQLDLVGLFPPSDGFTFLLTCIDRYTRWPEVIPVSDISAEAVAKSLIANWISRFGVPAIITTGQGGQLHSRLLYNLKQMLGIQRIQTTPYHPSSNGMVERLHCTLKQAIRCHDTKWRESLPVVLLGLRACIKEDLNSSCAEMVFGKPLCFQENSLHRQVRPQLIPPSFS
ncbi:transposon Tf2-9 polyprotein [Trichonephila inaurata madagascariensis]|uniref:RNA-directed DNA polymerase n=1 Tax=Trichonephila inaurata madagascariensis TaxID=2747483 RepID=A0A8X7C237_9ARAC|nr:transposon Tf2-9 polyprotein [Trichonephila inaurata madagascariensis]